MGLHIVNYTREQIKADHCINQFMETNRSQEIPQLHPPLTQIPYTGVTVAHQNIQGLRPHRKLVDKHAMLTTANIICMLETHLKSLTVAFKSIATLNFYIEQNERTLSTGGGIAICIHKSLGPIEKIDVAQARLELLHVKILSTPPTHVICTYKPPDINLNDCTEQLSGHIQEKASIQEQCMILGDFNDNIFSLTCSILLQTVTSLDFTQHIHQAANDY